LRLFLKEYSKVVDQWKQNVISSIVWMRFRNYGVECSAKM